LASHPLDNEDVMVRITLVHIPTGSTVEVFEKAPCDSNPTVSNVIARLGEKAKDALLNELESH
jgi:hypothetical protein